MFRRDLARDLLREGKSYRTIAGTLGIPVAALHSALQQYDGCSERGSGATTTKTAEKKAETTRSNRSAKRPLVNTIGPSEDARKDGTES